MPDPAQTAIVQKMIDAGESEDNIATVIQHFAKASAPPPAPVSAPVDRGGLFHPLTSIAAPELESLRGSLNAATQTPHGQPIMARSRTGTLYPSETGHPPGQSVAQNVGDIAKASARGAGGAGIDQLEAVTSPVGLAAAGLSQMTGPLQKIAAGAYEAFRPSQILGDIEKARTLSPGKVGARMLGRAAKAIRTAGDVTPEAEAATTTAVPPASAPKPSPAAAGPLSDLELAQQEVAAGRLPKSALAAIERAQQPPTSGPLTPVTARPPIKVAPDSPMQPPPNMPSPARMGELQQKFDGTQGVNPALQQPRVDVGAEAVGRQQGLTTDAVRQQTGPILNEAPGEASPVFPQKPFERMHDKLLAMGHGNPERIDYVKAAADPKTAGLLEIMRRTMERNGISLAGGTTMAEAMRQALTGHLSGQDARE